MYTVSPWVVASVLSLQTSLFPWWVIWGLVTTLSALAIQWFPGVRVRRLFASPAPGLWRWLAGEYSVRATLGWGAAGLGVMGWGASALGAWPLSLWGLALLGVVCVLQGVALLNAGRKSGLTGARCLALSGVVGGVGALGLWLGMMWLGRVMGVA
ncbi:TPA: hypothetical protein KEY88_005425 [Serratia marcescens]|nr:hypothetical protein [Serratia marcescens]